MQSSHLNQQFMISVNEVMCEPLEADNSCKEDLLSHVLMLIISYNVNFKKTSLTLLAHKFDDHLTVKLCQGGSKSLLLGLNE